MRNFAQRIFRNRLGRSCRLERHKQATHGSIVGLVRTLCISAAAISVAFIAVTACADAEVSADIIVRAPYLNYDRMAQVGDRLITKAFPASTLQRKTLTTAHYYCDIRNSEESLWAEFRCKATGDPDAPEVRYIVDFGPASNREATAVVRLSEESTAPSIQYGGKPLAEDCVLPDPASGAGNFPQLAAVPIDLVEKEALKLMDAARPELRQAERHLSSISIPDAWYPVSTRFRVVTNHTRHFQPQLKLHYTEYLSATVTAPSALWADLPTDFRPGAEKPSVSITGPHRHFIDFDYLTPPHWITRYHHARSNNLSYARFPLSATPDEIPESLIKQTTE